MLHVCGCAKWGVPANEHIKKIWCDDASCWFDYVVSVVSVKRNFDNELLMITLCYFGWINEWQLHTPHKTLSPWHIGIYGDCTTRSTTKPLKFIVTANAVNNANAHPRDYVWLFGLQCKLCTMWRVCVCVEYILLSLLINVLRNAYTNGIKFSHPCDATIMFILWMYEWYGWLCGCLLTLSHTYIHPHQHNELCKIVHTKCPNVMSSFSPQFEWITDLHLYNAIVVVFDWKRWELLNRIDVRCAFGTKNYANNNSMWCVHICSTQHSTEHSRKT